MRSITKVVIHHSASNSVTTRKADLDRWHKARGFLQIGYHKVIERDGGVVDGRAESSEGAHAKGANTHSLGVCVVGDFETEVPTSEQLTALASLLIDWCTTYGIADKDIHGHGAVPGGTTATACPGQHLAVRLPEIRAKIRAALGQRKGARA